ncbi:MAG: hypothetical protein ACM3X7_05075 [Solirubrobacterales bacterium]
MIKTQCINIDEIDFSKQILKGKKLKLIVKDEEVYILNMVLPKLNRFALNDVIRGELSLRYKNNDNIMFDYSIISKSNNKIHARVFCFHFEDKKTINSVIEAGGIIKSVIPVQFHVLEKYHRKIKHKNYYFVFIYFDRIYLMEVINNIVEMNKIVNEFTLEEKFKSNEIIKTAYHLNIEENIISNYFAKGFELINLGERI